MEGDNQIIETKHKKKDKSPRKPAGCVRNVEGQEADAKSPRAVKQKIKSDKGMTNENTKDEDINAKSTTKEQHSESKDKKDILQEETCDISFANQFENISSSKLRKIEQMTKSSSYHKPSSQTEPDESSDIPNVSQRTYFSVLLIFVIASLGTRLYKIEIPTHIW